LSIAVLPLIGGLWFWGLYGEITRYRRIYLKKDDSHGL
jgi:hypothetical protein